VSLRPLAALLGLGLLSGCAAPAGSPSATVEPADPETSAATPPDGRIAFSRTVFDPATNTPTGGDIWSVAADGSDLVQLTDTPEIELYPAWSPDGRRLAFVRLSDMSNGDIWVIDADATAADRHLTQLTDGQALEFAPAWSPDGTDIAYVDDWQDAPSIWIRAADGTGDARRIADGNWPSWTPDGSRLLVTVGADFTDTELAYVDVDGGEPEILPIGLPNASEGAVNALGGIAFVSSPNDYADDDPATWNEEVYVVGPDGVRGPTRITNTPENDHWPPSWSPDAEWVAYTNDAGTSGSRIAIVLGTGEPIYLTDGAYDAFPAWRPKPGA
jgi:Tol biopolymer transport system component